MLTLPRAYICFSADLNSETSNSLAFPKCCYKMLSILIWKNNLAVRSLASEFSLIKYANMNVTEKYLSSVQIVCLRRFDANCGSQAFSSESVVCFWLVHSLGFA